MTHSRSIGTRYGTLAAKARVWGLAAIFCAATPAWGEAATIFVKAGTTGTATGASWADAYTSLQDGLAAAASGDDLWVAAGTYKPDLGAGITPGNTDASFNLKDGVALYGGFAGNETDLLQRNWSSNKAILSGDLGGDDQPSFVQYEENCALVVQSSSQGTLDGFTVSGARTAGISCSVGSYPFAGKMTVRNCTVEKNLRNGLIVKGKLNWPDETATPWMDMAGASVSNCIFKNNVNTDSLNYAGAGAYVNYATVDFTHCTFMNNSTTGDGGGLYSYVANVTVANSIFWNNTPLDSQVWARGDFYASSYCKFIYNDVHGLIFPNSSLYVTSHDNIDTDPLLTVDGRLQTGSPCIDAGDPLTTTPDDIDDEARPYGTAPDMGADEFIDTDGDGLPDSWEILYGLDPNDNGSVNGKNGANGDPDGDGFTNLQEYVNGTSPLVSDISPDDDGDGYRVDQGDCNDANPAVHPGAAKNCSDGLDNDCNGLIDAADPLCAPTYGMGCLYDAQCGEGLSCKKAEGVCDGVGSCQPLPRAGTVCPLTLVYAPVCGCDGKTYTGACEAGLAGVNVAAQGECATAGYKWTYYFPSIKDNDAIGWENYLSVQAKEPVTMAVTIRVYDMAGNLAGTFIYSDTDPAARAKAVAPNARVALRPSLITGGAIEGSIIVETSVPAIATTNCIASYYKGFSIYEAAKVRPIHYFPKAYDGPDFYQVYMVVQNIFPEPRKVTAVLAGKTTMSPGHGANQTTTIPAYGTWKFRPSDIAGGINFDGSVSVFSDLTTPRDALGPPIPAMCRYEAGTDALAIYESAARQPRLFFPVLKDGKFGTTLDYQNYISVVNMNPQAANVSVILYGKSGAEEGRLTDTIPSSGKKTWRPSTIKGTGAAPADFDGLVVIISDQTLFGQTNSIYPGVNKYGADAFDLFESAMRNKTLFFPKAYDNLLGAGTGATHLTDNVVYVSNPDGSYKNLKIEQFNNNGTANGATTVALAPFSTHVYRPKNLVTDNSGVFRGSVKVTETAGLPITGAIKYEVHKTTDPGSGIEAMSIYRSMGQ